jgi:DNA polymerase-4
MDCFYAAIEVRDRPALRGKPIGVGGARDRRGVLTTCNYEARKFGVRSAMPTFMALQRCPNLIVLPTRFDVYRREAAVIRDILGALHLWLNSLLDEAYLDVSEHPGAAEALAQVIWPPFRKTKPPPRGLSNKPGKDRERDQQTERPTVTPKSAKFMAELPVRKIWGIGRDRAEAEQLGIKTCGELQDCASTCNSSLADLGWSCTTCVAEWTIARSNRIGHANPSARRKLSQPICILFASAKSRSDDCLQN